MNGNNRLCVKLIHCGNSSIANPTDREQKNIFLMPMGLFALADGLRKNGVDVEIIHSDLEKSKGIEEILDFKTLDAVGFDCHWVNQGLVVMETAESIKRIKPGVFIFLGGFTASLFAGEIITNFSQVDAVIRGDGEIPIIELCKALTKKKINPAIPSLEKVPNLAWRKENHRLQLNEFNYIGTKEEMEKLDFAAVDLLRNWPFYRSACLYFTHFEPFTSEPVFYLEVGRGCPHACIYCGGNCEAQKRMNNRDHTTVRSVDSVIATIKKAITFGFKSFYTCMEFEGSDRWYIRLFNRIKEENIKINFCYGSWKLPGNALIDALSESFNETLIEISPETADHHTRKINKDPRLFYTNRQLEECLDYTGKKGNIKVQLYFGYYLLSDTPETILDTLWFLVDMLIKYHRFLEVEYSNFSTDPGSLLFLHPGKYDIDIRVRNFNDYMHFLKENYRQKKGQPADMILYLPKSIPTEKNAALRKKIMLFNHLFSAYPKSVSYILEKTKTPDIIMEILAQEDPPITSDNRFPSQKMKEILVKSSEKKGILDMYLYKIVGWESKLQDLEFKARKPTEQLYLDFRREEKIMAEIESNTVTSAGQEAILEAAPDKVTDLEDFEF